VVLGLLLLGNCALLSHPEIFLGHSNTWAWVIVLLSLADISYIELQFFLHWVKVAISFCYTFSGKGSEAYNTPRGKTNTIGQILTCKYFLEPEKTVVKVWLVRFIVDGILRWLNFQNLFICDRPHISFNVAFILKLPCYIIILTLLGD
jgi:hypothetical protein